MNQKAVPSEQEYELVSLESLKLHPRNARMGDVSAIEHSIKQNGFFGACVVQKSTRFILAGNHRYLAAREAGLVEVPVLWVDVDDDRALRILLVDNRTNDDASYNREALAELLSELAGNSDLLGTGYDSSDLDNLIKDLAGNTGSDSGSDSAGDSGSGPIPAQWAVYVECPDEPTQTQLLERLTEEGYSCRALTS